VRIKQKFTKYAKDN